MVSKTNDCASSSPFFTALPSMPSAFSSCVIPAICSLPSICSAVSLNVYFFCDATICFTGNHTNLFSVKFSTSTIFSHTIFSSSHNDILRLPAQLFVRFTAHNPILSTLSALKEIVCSNISSVLSSIASILSKEAILLYPVSKYFWVNAK